MSLQRILPASTSLPLHDRAGTRIIEQQAMAGLPAHTLMRRAGLAVARLGLAVAPHARRVWIAAGPGNNGGDGLDAAIHLQAAGRDVLVTLASDSAALPEDARDACARAQAAGVRVAAPDAAWLASLDGDDLAIDALLGIGARRAPEGAVAEAMARLAALACPVLAVDLPSGLDADTGRALGGLPVHARHTLALLTLKPGLFTAMGRDAAGTVWLDTLGVDLPAPGSPAASAARAWLVGPDRAAPFARARRHGTHKGSYGDVAVLAGAPGMTGAALLAARAASAAGAGRVFVQLLDGGSLAVDALQPELMLRPHWTDRGAGALASATVVAGCGGGESIAALLPRLLSAVPRLVLDADALNAIAADSSLAILLATRAARAPSGFGTVLTPHPLEAARLLGVDSAAVQADRLGAAEALAGRCRCTVLLKGSGSVIASPGCASAVNGSGNASLATAGTGDVLAGWIGGLWSASRAEDFGEELPSHPIAAAAAWLHGAAADAAPRDGPLRACDLAARMAEVRAALAPPD